MKYYVVGPGEGYEWLFPDDVRDYHLLEQLDGSPCRHKWMPVKVHLDKADERHPGWKADFPWSGFGLVMRERAKNIVGPLIESNGEILPLRSEGSQLCIFNARVIDALDESKSSIKRFSSGRIMAIEAATLVLSKAADWDIFRVFPKSALFVSERFVALVNEHKLSGLTFAPTATY